MVDTVRNIGDDVFHFLISFMMLFATLGILAVYMFGASHSEFNSIGAAFFTQFKMIIGEYPWLDDSVNELKFSYQLYLGTFTFIVYFILLNFFLAIVVDAYSNLKHVVKDKEADNSLHKDIWELAKGRLIGLREQYPHPAKISAYLQRDLFNRLRKGDKSDIEIYLKGEVQMPNAITADELLMLAKDDGGAPLFKSRQHALNYIKCYAKKVWEDHEWKLLEQHPERLYPSDRYEDDGRELAKPRSRAAAVHANSLIRLLQDKREWVRRDTLQELERITHAAKFATDITASWIPEITEGTAMDSTLAPSFEPPNGLSNCTQEETQEEGRRSFESSNGLSNCTQEQTQEEGRKPDQVPVFCEALPYKEAEPRQDPATQAAQALRQVVEMCDNPQLLQSLAQQARQRSRSLWSRDWNSALRRATD